MREDIPEWLGKPPMRGSTQWDTWLQKWREYARTVLKDTAADDPDFDFGLLSVEERWQVDLMLTIRDGVELGKQGSVLPSIPESRKTTDLKFANVIAWQVGRSISKEKNPELEGAELLAEAWAEKHTNPKRRRLSHGIRYGFLAGLGGEAAMPAWSTPDYVTAYEAAWNMGNAIAIEADPR